MSNLLQACCKLKLLSGKLVSCLFKGLLRALLRRKKEPLPPSKASEPGIEPAFPDLKGKRNNLYTERGYTRWDRWFTKSLSTSIFRDWFPKQFARKYFRGQPTESEMATFPQPSLLSGKIHAFFISVPDSTYSILYQEQLDSWSGWLKLWREKDEEFCCWLRMSDNTGVDNKNQRKMLLRETD
ncbi:hypothetical protein AVEN_50367-1 [Araneus ventricosus]|uniref:Uncharacterized protein n=1 Tax=Araneus ventricosus TaxID=182803 RepID=A0A4Y2E790_ARAVE|nr:hypothetical protein AVEN_50367-1 [Araneus ventricosus]